MSAVLVEVTTTRNHEEVVTRALDAFGADIHYLEDMVKVAQRVLTKRTVRVVVDD